MPCSTKTLQGKKSLEEERPLKRRKALGVMFQYVSIRKTATYVADKGLKPLVSQGQVIVCSIRPLYDNVASHYI